MTKCKYKIEVFHNRKLHIEHSAVSKEHLIQIWNGFFPLYEGLEYCVSNLVDNKAIIQGIMDSHDLDILSRLESDSENSKISQNRISGIIIEHGPNYFGLWKGFVLSEEDENAIWNILSKYDTDGCSISGTWKEIVEEYL